MSGDNRRERKRERKRVFVIANKDVAEERKEKRAETRKPQTQGGEGGRRRVTNAWSKERRRDV